MPDRSTRRALVTLPDVAVPTDSGRRLRSWSTLVGLSRHFELDVVLPLQGLPADSHRMPASAAVRRSLAVAPDERSAAASALAAMRGSLPWTLAHQDWSPVRSALAPWIDGERYDLVWFGAVSHALALHATVPAARQVVDFDDVQSVKWAGYLKDRTTGSVDHLDRVQRRIELPMWRRIERRVSRSLSAVVIADPDDAVRCEALGIRNTRTVPNSYPDPGFLPPRAAGVQPVVVFVANFAHDPNREAARTLADRVLPALRAVLPDARLRLVGRAADLIADLSSCPGVELVGPVEDVVPHMADAIATLLPITFGGGTRLKALEAFALGVPVISTRVGVAGIGAIDGIHYLRADTAAEFAQRTLRLTEDLGLTARLTAAARGLYQESFTTKASSDAIADLVGSTH